MPSLSALRAFEAAARLGSFKEAAEKLAVSPTAVSHHIRGLEQYLGVSLFMRETRAVHPTDAGKRLASRLTTAFGEIEAALSEVETAEHVLRVSTTPAFAVLWLVPRLHAFHEANPDIRVQVDTGTEPIDLHRDRQVDIAIRYGTRDLSSMNAVPLCDEDFGFYGSPDYVSKMNGLGTATLLVTEWRQPGLKAVSPDDWLAAFASQPAPKTRMFDQEHHAIQCAVAGQGIAFLSNVLAADLVDRGLLIAYREGATIPGLSYTLLALPERVRTRKISLFTRWIESRFSANRTRSSVHVHKSDLA